MLKSYVLVVSVLVAALTLVAQPAGSQDAAKKVPQQNVGGVADA